MLESEDQSKKIYLFAPNRDFVRPYFEHLLSEYEISNATEGSDYAVMISSTDIYNVNQGENYNEFTPVKNDSPEFLNETEFSRACSGLGLNPLILRCSNIVGTGMNGFVREMAEKIYKGYYLNIADNDACVSVVHAVDLPVIAKQLLETGGTYNVTDGRMTGINDLADALAWRMGQKRVFSISAKWYKFLLGKKKERILTTTLTFSSEKLMSVLDFKPVSVVEYLKTHVYDKESL